MVDGICRELLVTEVDLCQIVSCFTCDPVDSNQTDCLLFYVLITANGMKWEGEPTLIFLLVDTLQKFYQATARQEAKVDKVIVYRITGKTHSYLDIWMVGLDGRNPRWVEVLFVPVGNEFTISGRRRGRVCVVNGEGKDEVEINVGINGFEYAGVTKRT
ncbi:unnamed protein product [Camellia sinensis]